MWTRVTMVLVPLGMAVSFATSGGEMSVPDLLDKYEATQVSLRNFSTKSTDVSDDVAGSSREFVRDEAVLYSDGDRVHWRSQSWRNLKTEEESAPLEEAANRSYLWNGKVAYEYRKFRDSGGDLFVHSHDRDKMGFLTTGYCGSPLMGIFVSDTVYVGSILRKAETLSVRPDREQVAGSSCFVLDAKSKYGAYTVWLDPEHGYNIAKAIVHKKKGDLAWESRPLGLEPDLSKISPVNISSLPVPYESIP